ncbi:hypothetical protein DPMN_140112 [Dreissena polymorpha]|uniref:Uncharacterized protein n=1 Tax=Dreissena polymorpha TaxID=45954 RepID=A0A9D4GCX1_DREPO|nr:hypothetical protein DPMN_140112 [Dreissena polymorpha]
MRIRSSSDYSTSTVAGHTSSSSNAHSSSTSSDYRGTRSYSSSSSHSRHRYDHHRSSRKRYSRIRYYCRNRSSSRHRSCSRSRHYRNKGRRQASLKHCLSDFYDRSHYYSISDFNVAIPFAPVSIMMFTHDAVTDSISQPFYSGVHLTTTAVLSAPRASTFIASRNPRLLYRLCVTHGSIFLWNYVPVISDNSPSIFGFNYQCVDFADSHYSISEDNPFILTTFYGREWQHHSPGIGHDGDLTMLTSLLSRSISDHMMTTVSRFMLDGIGQGLQTPYGRQNMTGTSPGTHLGWSGHRSPVRGIGLVTGQYYGSPVNTNGDRAPVIDQEQRLIFIIGILSSSSFKASGLLTSTDKYVDVLHDLIHRVTLNYGVNLIVSDHLETLGDVTLRDVVSIASDLILGFAGISSSSCFT